MPPGMLDGIPRSMEALAYLYVAYRLTPEAILVRVKATGRLCAWRGGVLTMVDQRKATAALERMEWIARNEKGKDDEDTSSHEG